MKCQIERLIDFLENELPAEDRVQVQEHLKTCDTCIEELTALEETFDTLHQNQRIELPSEEHFDLLLKKTKQNLGMCVNISRKQPSWFQVIVELFQVPSFAVAFATIVLVITLTVTTIGDFNIFQKENVYSTLSKELTSKTAPLILQHEETDFMIEELEQMDGNDLLVILKGIEV